MAYAAVISLLQTLKQIHLSDQLTCLNQNPQIESLQTKTLSLQTLLEKSFSQISSTQSEANDLETLIRDAIYEAEDIIESYISTRFLQPSKQDSSLSTDLDKILQELDAIEEKAKTIVDKYSSSGQATARSARAARKLVGLENSIRQLKDQLMGENQRIRVVSVVGMAGIGKTTLVNEVYNDRSIKQYFSYMARATVGLKYSRRDVLIALLESGASKLESDPKTYHDSKLTEAVYRNLKGRRYLIVLDDISDVRAWDNIKKLFPDDENGSQVMLTTRLRNLALYAAGTMRNVFQVRFLTADESWDLLRYIVFGDELCPYDLLKIGKKIAQNCQGLPLTVVHVGEILAKAPRTLEYWTKVADSQTSASIDGEDDVGLSSMMNFLNDEHLPQHLKACFLYMGAFPINYEVPASKLINLWVSEGFLKPKESKSMERVAEEYLEELVDRSLMLVHSRRSHGGIKACSVHSAVWHLCVNAAEKDKFFRAINRYKHREPLQSMSNLRRICVRNSVLFGIKEMRKSILLASTARSLLCLGPDHTHPLPIILQHHRLLRVLHALSVRFFEFPKDTQELIQLRYLALTCNVAKVPETIFEIWNLHVLIVQHYLNIKSSQGTSFLPLKIWKMKQLRHLQVTGCDLPKPGEADRLPNLLTLTNVSSSSCTTEVLQRTPNLKKLGIQIELGSENVATPSHVFNHLRLLTELESFKCAVVNPNLTAHVVARPVSASRFPYTLKKLTLSGCRFRWEDLKLLAHLPNLLALKLHCYALEGSDWTLDMGEFIKLKFLMLEDLDIERWTATGTQILEKLECLIVRHCYRLQEIPLGVDYIATLQKMEIVDCSPSVVASAQRVKDMQEDLSNDGLQAIIVSSWELKGTKR